jgi:hypothetical protein
MGMLDYFYSMGPYNRCPRKNEDEIYYLIFELTGLMRLNFTCIHSRKKNPPCPPLIEEFSSVFIPTGHA